MGPETLELLTLGLILGVCHNLPQSCHNLPQSGGCGSS